MVKLLNKKSTISDLSNFLLSTLDESIFFSELSQFLSHQVGVDEVKSYLVKDDLSAKLLSDITRFTLHLAMADAGISRHRHDSRSCTMAIPPIALMAYSPFVPGTLADEVSPSAEFVAKYTVIEKCNYICSIFSYRP